MDSEDKGPLTRDEAIELMTAAESPLHVTKTSIRGIEYQVFKHAPNDMRDLFDYSNEHFRDRDFLVYEKERYTYGDVHQKSVALAHSLVALGIEPGDRVAISMRNYPEYVIALEAILATGAVALHSTHGGCPKKLNTAWLIAKRGSRLSITSAGIVSFLQKTNWISVLPLHE